MPWPGSSWVTWRSRPRLGACFPSVRSALHQKPASAPGSCRYGGSAPTLIRLTGRARKEVSQRPCPGTRMGVTSRQRAEKPAEEVKIYSELSGKSNKYIYTHT